MRLTRATSKALEKQLESDGYLVLQFMVAEKLGMTVAELRERMTPAELAGWNAFFNLRNRHEREAAEKARSRRR
jgi:hypothetical protein